ncbi:MAG: rod shape-determining protein RodA [Gammaproteobacteria bacterium]|nr:rod shape-determining protein RodA [Gammaproteobacteria bacterium]
MTEATLFQSRNPRALAWLNYLHFDGWLFLGLLLILGLGLTVMTETLSHAPALLIRHIALIVLGLTALLILAQLPEHLYVGLTPIAYVGAVLLLAYTLFWGDEAKGAMRWVDWPFVPRFQPSEILKIILPLSLAWYLHDKPAPLGIGHALVCWVIIGIPVGLVFLQPDFGTTVLVATGSLCVVFVAGLRWRWIFAAVIVAMVGFVVAWRLFLTPYQISRIVTFLDPDSNPLGAGWNIIQSKIALGSGGVTGKGLGEGTQSHLSFLPEGHTDFILAVIGEELGFVGTAILLTLFFFVFARGMIMSRSAASRFGRLMSAGFLMMFFGYTLVNVMMVCGLLPVVGAPLPLVSYGGTSIVTMLAGFGIVTAMQRS